ncbi:Uncharacterised protein [uncultured archaeon]|nr:Uncharacterised protein [uncultured archaeon]
MGNSTMTISFTRTNGSLNTGYWTQHDPDLNPTKESQPAMTSAPASSTTPAAKKTLKQQLEEAAYKADCLKLRTVLLDLVMKNTPGLNGKAVKQKDPKVAAIEEVIKNGRWGGSSSMQNDVKNLCEALLGIPLDLTKPSYMPQPFMLAVPLDNINSHDYTVGNVSMFFSSGGSHAIEVVKGVARTGNSHDASELGNPKHYRFPSKAEAEEFVTKVLSTPSNIAEVKKMAGRHLP